jgi:hypothetical protein
MNKVYSTAAEVIADIPDGATELYFDDGVRYGAFVVE